MTFGHLHHSPPSRSGLGGHRHTYTYTHTQKATAMQHLVQTTRFGDITGENTIAKVAHCNTCGTDLDVSSVGTQTHLALRRLLEHVETKHPELFEPLPIADELLPGCCTCCAAAIERQDPIGHGPNLLRCPCSPLEECTPIVEGFSDPDGVPAARFLKDLPHLGLAAGSEWLLMGARR